LAKETDVAVIALQIPSTPQLTYAQNSATVFRQQHTHNVVLKCRWGMKYCDSRSIL